jgi:hypothetical protein
MPQLGIPATIVAFITLQQITNLSTLVVNSDNINSVASDDVELAAPAASATQSDSYVKVKEIRINYAGIHRIKFTLQLTGGAYIAYGKIYKNGQPWGTERSTAGGPVLFTEDLQFSKGDLVQLYLKTNDTFHVPTAQSSVMVTCGTVALGSITLDNQLGGGSLGYINVVENVGA